MGIAWQAHQRRGRVVPPAHQCLVVVLAIYQNHPPEQAVEGRRCAEHPLDLDALAGDAGLHALFGHLLAGKGETQVASGQHQRVSGPSGRAAMQASQRAGQHRDQQRHAVERVDDEDAGPGDRWSGQRP